jgi:hypothetical protein
MQPTNVKRGIEIVEKTTTLTIKSTQSEPNGDKLDKILDMMAKMEENHRKDISALHDHIDKLAARNEIMITWIMRQVGTNPIPAGADVQIYTASVEHRHGTDESDDETPSRNYDDVFSGDSEALAEESTHHDGERNSDTLPSQDDDVDTQEPITEVLMQQPVDDIVRRGEDPETLAIVEMEREALRRDGWLADVQLSNDDSFKAFDGTIETLEDHADGVFDTRGNERVPYSTINGEDDILDDMDISGNILIAKMPPKANSSEISYNRTKETKFEKRDKLELTIGATFSEQDVREVRTEDGYMRMERMEKVEEKMTLGVGTKIGGDDVNKTDVLAERFKRMMAAKFAKKSKKST